MQRYGLYIVAVSILVIGASYAVLLHMQNIQLKSLNAKLHVELQRGQGQETGQKGRINNLETEASQASSSTAVPIDTSKIPAGLANPTQNVRTPEQDTKGLQIVNCSTSPSTGSVGGDLINRSSSNIRAAVEFVGTFVNGYGGDQATAFDLTTAVVVPAGGEPFTLIAI